MIRQSWGDDDKKDYDALLQKVIEGAEGTGARVDLMEKLVNDAIQAHRFWARETEREAALYDTATFDELRDKRREALRQVRTYSDTVALLDRLLALAELYPDASSVATALIEHGMSLDEYLGVAEAA